MARTRSFLKSSGTGYLLKHNGSVLQVRENLGVFRETVDNPIPGDGHPFDVKTISVFGMVVEDQKYGGAITGSWWKNRQPDFVQAPYSSLYAHSSTSGRPTDAILAAKLLSETNPSRPVVDLPIALFELKDIPDLLRKEGQGWIRKLASQNLKYHFAIKPLVSDVINLLRFGDEVAKRDKELRALATSGLRRKRRLWSGVSNSSREVTVNSANRANLKVIADMATTHNVHGFVEWFPQDPMIMLGDSRALARKAVLGLTVDFSTAWEAMPWSWLIDWCSNVGDILAANRNTVGATHGKILIMDTIDTTAICKPNGYDPGLEPGGYRLNTKKRRAITSVPVSAQLPILSKRQLSILGSIGVTRRVPRNP